MKDDTKARLATLARHYGQLPAQRERVKEILSQVNDWYGTCRACGKMRTGLLSEITLACSCKEDHDG